MHVEATVLRYGMLYRVECDVPDGDLFDAVARFQRMQATPVAVRVTWESWEVEDDPEILLQRADDAREVSRCR